MARQSGKNGIAKQGGVDIAYLRQWTMDRTVNHNAEYHSGSPTFPERVQSNQDATGTIEVLLNDGVLPSWVTDSIDNDTEVTLALYGISTATPHTGPAKMLSIASAANIGGGDTEVATINWGANGTWTFANA